jgi:hypothetical protein
MMAGIMIRESLFARDEIGVLGRWPKTLCYVRGLSVREQVRKSFGPETVVDFRAEAMVGQS